MGPSAAWAQAQDTPDYKSMNLQQLMNVDVTSVTKAPESYAEAAASIVVVTSDDIEGSGATSIPEALRQADNLEVDQKNAHDWGISARGFNTALSNKLLVLIDGRTVYTPLFSGVFWDVQNYLLKDLDRIEVVSGPGGTLWGANAVNGVINVISKSAKDTQGTYAEVGMGSELEDSEAVRYGGSVGSDVYYRVYAQRSDRSDEELQNGQPASDAWNQEQAGFRIDADKGSAGILTLQGDVYGGDEDEPTGGTARVGGGNLLGRWTYSESADAQSTVQTYYDQTHLVDPEPASAYAPAGTLVDNLGTYDFDFQQSFKTGQALRWVTGVGYRFTRDAVTNAPSIGVFPTRLDQSLLSAFAQGALVLPKNMTLTLGTKAEHNAYTGMEWEPNVRLQADVAHGQMLWAAVSRAVRTPSRVDRDIREPSEVFTVLSGGADFESETLVAYELGYRGEITRSAAASVSLFYNQYNDIRSLGYTPATIIPLIFQNNLEADTYGVELSTTFQMADSWRLHLGYDWLSEDVWVKPGQIDLNHALNETGDPKNQVFLRSTWAVTPKIRFDSDLRWIDSLRINNGGAPATVPAYGELDLRLAWQMTREIELSLVGDNLLHSRHIEYGVPSPTNVAIQRSVYAKAAWSY